MSSLRDDIADLVHDYADAVVRRDADAWAATWAPDARWVLGPGRDVTGRDVILDVWEKAMGRFSAVVQMVANGKATPGPTADTASGRWYIFENFLLASGETGILLAYYDDTYVRVDGKWLFASRELTRQYQGAPGLSAPFLNAVEA
jgi:uncharacterized protein (TIGR02246 family)